MQSQGSLSELSGQGRLKQFAFSKWETLTDRQKRYAKKVWSVITYKWRWQIAMNVPYLLIFILDRTIPTVHQFDMALLDNLASTLPLPAFIVSWLGIG